jgi:hypothetical protein
MILITSFYIPNNELREKEINLCLQKNYENPLITKIYLLNNEIYEFPKKLSLNENENENEKNNKIQQIIINSFPNYKLRFDDAINFINNCEECKNRYCILSNSDIYFDETLEKINNTTITNNVFALLRYDQNVDNSLFLYSENNRPRINSQDSWIFKSPLKIDINRIDFEFGVLGCDNAFANVIYTSGIYISNPCYDIKTIHVHSSNFRTYNNNSWICRDYCYVVPCRLREMPNVFLTDWCGNPIKTNCKLQNN